LDLPDDTASDEARGLAYQAGMETGRMSYRLLISDSEAGIGEMVQKSVPLSDIGLELVGVATNGAELLRLADALYPDVILTEISLPIEDGLECVRRIRPQGACIHFIVMSASRRFEHVYKALKYGVNDYILKPINPGELTETLRKAVAEVHRARENASSRDHSEAIRELFANTLSSELDLLKKPLEEINRIYDTHFHSGFFCELLIRVDHTKDAILVFDIFPKLQQKIIELITDHCRRYCHDILFRRRFNEIMAILNFPESYYSEIKDELYKLLESIKGVIAAYDDLDVTLSMGGVYDSISMIVKSRDEAHSAAWTRMSRGAGKVLFWEEKDTCPDFLKQRLGILNERFKQACAILDIDEFKKCAAEFFRLPDELLSRREAKALVMGTLDYFYEVNSELIESFADKGKMYNETKQILLLSCSFSEFKRNFISQFTKVFEQIIAASLTKNIKYVRQAIQYVEINFNKKIGLEAVAKKVHLSPVYFSHIFKRETGKNFTEYVNEYRVSVAKTILKESTNSIKEVAYELGYSDPRYLSKVFKKIVGIDPTAYRKIYK
jgi:two-component system response regulator YesN